MEGEEILIFPSICITNILAIISCPSSFMSFHLYNFNVHVLGHLFSRAVGCMSFQLLTDFLLELHSGHSKASHLTVFIL